MGVGELPVESRFANAGLADDGHHLTATGPDSLQGLTKLAQFAVTADKAGQPTDGCGVKPGAHGPCADEFVDLDRLREALHRDRSPGRDLNVAFGELQGRGG